MRKHLLAVLSILGLAGSSTPASAQVVNGAKKADAKSESTMKKSKLSQEDAASKDAQKAKFKAQSAEGGQATSGASAQTMRKAGGDPQVQSADYMKHSKSKAELKASQGAAEYKEQKALGDGSVKTATGTTAHGSGGGAGKVAHQEIVKTNTGGGAGKVAMQDVHIKGEKSAAEVKAGQQNAAQKQRKQVDQASPK